jgi:hypothetical protein
VKTLVEGRVGVEVEARKEEASKSYEGVLVIGVEGGGGAFQTFQIIIFLNTMSNMRLPTDVRLPSM